MQTDIQALNFPMTKALHHYIEKRMQFALGNRDRHIQRLIVRLSDINGPRGGKDKCCHIHVFMPKVADVVIEDTEEDMYMAIDKASDRACSTIGRQLERHKDKLQSRARPIPAQI